LGSERFARDFNETKRLGALDSPERTPAQTETARFNTENPTTYWARNLGNFVAGRNLAPTDQARALAQLWVSFGDASIGCFESKYTYNFWRPVTAVQFAGTDGNPHTEPNPTWLPLSTKTAPDPSYPGAHSAISKAGATVLSFYFGDQFTFDVSSESLAGVTRHFSTFSAAAEEAGFSRIYAGQHFRTDHVAGKSLGRQVAEFIDDNILLRQE
jgi:hypothetical protein